MFRAKISLGILIGCLLAGVVAGDYVSVPYHLEEGVYPNLLSLDLYCPNDVPDTERLPLVVYIHGGGWSIGDKSRVWYKPALFNEHGYVFASVNYRLSPDPIDLSSTDAVRYPVHYEDVTRALAWLVDHCDTYQIDPNRIGIMGHSAGAHIVALLATDDQFLNQVGLPLDTIKATVTLDAGGLDIPYYLSSASPLLENIYVNAFSSDQGVWQHASPINHVAADKGIGAILMIHQNRLNRILTHNRFIDSLDQAGVPYQRIIAKGYSHSDINKMVGAPEEDLITQPILDFLQDNLKSTPLTE